MEFKSCLLETGIESVLYDEPLREHSSWRIGGAADVLAEPASCEQLARLLGIIHGHKLNYAVIGDGSNILFDDRGFNGVLVKIGRRISGCLITGQTMEVQAGIAVPRLARKASLAGLSGLEHTVGIPGTLGGLVAMNGGSLGQAIGDAVKTVCCVDPSGKRMELGRDDCEFSYRHSIFLKKAWIITDVVLELQKGDHCEIARRMLDILRERRRKFPRRLPNCGSVFKGDQQLYTKYGPPGRVIEELGLKGLSVGDAEVSSLHANFIINKNNAKTTDILKLIRMVRNKVHQKTDVWLECEVRYVSPSGHIYPAHLHQVI